MVQLEALEMLSNQCEGKLHNLLGSLPADELGSLKQELVTIKQAFEIDELDSDEGEVLLQVLKIMYQYKCLFLLSTFSDLCCATFYAKFAIKSNNSKF